VKIIQSDLDGTDSIPNLDAVLATFERAKSPDPGDLATGEHGNYFAATTGVLAAGRPTPDVLKSQS